MIQIYQAGERTVSLQHTSLGWTVLVDDEGDVHQELAKSKVEGLKYFHGVKARLLIAELENCQRDVKMLGEIK